MLHLYFSEMKIAVTKQHQAKIHLSGVYNLCQWNDNEFISAGGDGQLLLWNIASPEKIILIQKLPAQIFSLAKLNDQLLIAGCINGIIYLIDIKEKSLLSYQDSLAGSVFDFLVLNETYFISAHKNGSVIYWNSELEQQFNLKIDNNSLRSMATENQSQLLMTGSSGKVFWIDALSKKIEKEIWEESCQKKI